jgi:hypothetical protein
MLIHRLVRIPALVIGMSIRSLGSMNFRYCTCSFFFLKKLGDNILKRGSQGLPEKSEITVLYWLIAIA